MDDEKENCISFCRYLITGDHTGTLHTNIYRKPTHSKCCLSFKSEHPSEYKSAVVKTLTHKTYSRPRNENIEHLQLKNLQNVLTLNGYPK